MTIISLPSSLCPFLLYNKTSHTHTHRIAKCYATPNSTLLGCSMWNLNELNKLSSDAISKHNKVQEEVATWLRLNKERILTDDPDLAPTYEDWKALMVISLYGGHNRTLCNSIEELKKLMDAREALPLHPKLIEKMGEAQMAVKSKSLLQSYRTLLFYGLKEQHYHDKSSLLHSFPALHSNQPLQAQSDDPHPAHSPSLNKSGHATLGQSSLHQPSPTSSHLPQSSPTPSAPLPSSPAQSSSGPSPPPHPMTTRSRTNSLKPKSLHPNFVRYPLPKALLAQSSTSEPTSFTEAVKHRVWRDAMRDEINALV